MRVPLAVKWPLYLAFRWLGRPRINPISLTVSVTNQCNHRCRTCFVYDHLQDDLTLAEYERIFRSIGRGVYYLTVSGGEPFLRRDLVEICSLARRYLDPKVLLLPTNGLRPGPTVAAVAEIARRFAGRQVVVNLSLDGIGEEHDAIRGRPGAYPKALETFAALGELEAPNLTRGIHTVVSKLNVDRFPAIHRALAELEPDSLICEVAELREELFNTDRDITPEPPAFARALRAMEDEAGRRRPRGLARLLAAFRRQYQRNALAILERGRQVPACQAGFMLAHISPAGDVWACCTEARSFGNLRDHDYDWSAVYFEGPRRHTVRRRIRRGECACPLANAGYVNILFHPPSLARVAWSLLLGGARG